MNKRVTLLIILASLTCAIAPESPSIDALLDGDEELIQQYIQQLAQEPSPAVSQLPQEKVVPVQPAKARRSLPTQNPKTPNKAHPLNKGRDIIKALGETTITAASPGGLESVYLSKAQELGAKGILKGLFKGLSYADADEETLQVIQMMLSIPQAQQLLGVFGSMVSDIPAHMAVNKAVDVLGRKLGGPGKWESLIEHHKHQQNDDERAHYFDKNNKFDFRKFLRSQSAAGAGILAAALESDLVQSLVTSRLSDANKEKAKEYMSKAGAGLRLTNASHLLYKTSKNLATLLNTDISQLKKPISLFVGMAKNLLIAADSIMDLAYPRNAITVGCQGLIAIGRENKSKSIRDLGQDYTNHIKTHTPAAESIKTLLNNPLFKLQSSELQLADSAITMVYSAKNAPKGQKLIHALKAAPESISEATESLIGRSHLHHDVALPALLRKISGFASALIRAPQLVPLIKTVPALIKHVASGEQEMPDELRDDLEEKLLTNMPALMSGANLF